MLPMASHCSVNKHKQQQLYIRIYVYIYMYIYIYIYGGVRFDFVFRASTTRPSTQRRKTGLFLRPFPPSSAYTSVSEPGQGVPWSNAVVLSPIVMQRGLRARITLLRRIYERWKTNRVFGFVFICELAPKEEQQILPVGGHGLAGAVGIPLAQRKFRFQAR